MLKDKLKFIFLPAFFLVFSFRLPAYQLGLQYQVENTYRNSLGPVVVLPVISSTALRLEAASSALFSKKDWEVLTNRIEATVPLISWLTLGTRLGHRVQLPEPFSRTTLLGYFRLESPPLGPISFYWLGGWYFRMVQLEKVSIIPFLGASSFSEQDFCTDLGMKFSLNSSTHWKLAVSTVDELEVYNLNHPFIESSWSLIDPISQSQWSATVRSQLLLGFGRIDRFVFGLAYLKNL